ncbi:MAG: hypothetical protein KIT02_07445 [Devosia sp.]|uniref:hypothetical protein n=1 Tax=Devosia sp. TaxID=1871048 RepID=UPI0024C8D4DD|nr:hypothetical protein [Devosia sp.]UYO01027.1 MAG: hypothetical protein KIT02_07445 [Devosia sp.]
MPRYLAIYTGTLDSEVQRAWDDLPEAEKADRSERAMRGWGQWAETYRDAIRDPGAPLGKTLLANPAGISSIRNTMAAYVIVEADSHEAAARMFENHPHFALFPGTGVEIMECLPMPGA